MAVRRVVERLDDSQQRHCWMGLPLAVVYRFSNDQGTYLAALITYYEFVFDPLHPPVTHYESQYVA